MMQYNPAFKSMTHPLGRNKRSVWTVTTQPYPDAHFATFPSALIEPCILAGTSAHGHCPQCGKGWKRIVERGEITEHPQRINRTEDAKQFHPDDNAYGESGSLGRVRMRHTNGWEPSCPCGLEPLSGIVLDPFMGSGTTAEVAQALGRRWLGCELNPEYAKLVADRTRQIGMVLA